jgi:hypothetical protein
MQNTHRFGKGAVTALVAAMIVLVPLAGGALAADRLTTGQSITRGEQLTSPDGSHRLILQEDGNLVLYSGDRAVWYTNSDGIAVKELVMQHNGELVLYKYDGRPAWSSRTRGDTSTFVVLQNDGNLVIYDKGKPIWYTNTAGR